MRHSDWDIVSVERDRVFVVDLNLGNLSVTNDAEAVWKTIQQVYPGKRLVYRDSMDQWDEICQQPAATQCNFKCYKEHTPDGY